MNKINIFTKAIIFTTLAAFTIPFITSAAFSTETISGGSGTGTVTSVTCISGLTGGTFTTSGTCGLDLTNPNSWTGLQQFTNATTSLLTVNGTNYWNISTPAMVGSGGGIAAPAFLLQSGGRGGDTTGTSVSQAGGTGSGLGIISGPGGDSLGESISAKGGIGGLLSLSGGTGGTAKALTKNDTGGIGGAFSITPGAGGIAVSLTSGTNTGGKGGALNVFGATGGLATNSTGVSTGGQGSTIAFTSGAGGAATGVNSVGGAAGPITFATGQGGTATTSGALAPITFSINATEGFRLANNNFIGVGTTSPYANLSIQTGASVGDAFVIATSSTASIAGYDNGGHRFTSGPAPAISSCGTGSPTVVGDDQSGDITTGTAATACTATFSVVYVNSPMCTVTDNSLVGFADISSVSASAVTFGISSALSGGHLYYSCSYHK